ncbi:hypothetical protein F7Q88_17095, partial [Castellaniella defragrans]
MGLLAGLQHDADRFGGHQVPAAHRGGGGRAIQRCAAGAPLAVGRQGERHAARRAGLLSGGAGDGAQVGSGLGQFAGHVAGAGRPAGGLPGGGLHSGGGRIGPGGLGGRGAAFRRRLFLAV